MPISREVLELCHRSNAWKARADAAVAALLALGAETGDLPPPPPPDLTSVPMSEEDRINALYDELALMANDPVKGDIYADRLGELRALQEAQACRMGAFFEQHRALDPVEAALAMKHAQRLLDDNEVKLTNLRQIVEELAGINCDCNPSGGDDRFYCLRCRSIFALNDLP